jgi:hypothetical protein
MAITTLKPTCNHDAIHNDTYVHNADFADDDDTDAHPQMMMPTLILKLLMPLMQLLTDDDADDYADAADSYQPNSANADVNAHDADANTETDAHADDSAAA